METLRETQYKTEFLYNNIISWVESSPSFDGYKMIPAGIVSKIEFPISKFVVVPFYLQADDSRISTLIIQLAGFGLTDKEPYFLVSTVNSDGVSFSIKKDLETLSEYGSDIIPELENQESEKISNYFLDRMNSPVIFSHQG